MQTSKAPMSEDAAARVLAALKNGRTLNSICNGRINGKRVAGERIAYYEQFRAYCAIHPDYARETNSLLVANTKLANAKKGAHKRDQTHCKRGHPLTEATVYFDRGGSHRKCKLCTAINSNFPPLPNEEQITRVTAALNAGQTISQICWGRVGDKITPGSRIIKFEKLKRYRELNPEYDRFVCSIISRSNGRAQQRRQNPQIFHTNVIRGQANDYHVIAGMVPPGLPPDVRDDIVQSIFLALLEGSLRRDQVKERVRQFVTAHNREANKHGVGKYGLRSLDAPIFDDGSGNLGDRISRGLWDDE